MRHPHPIAAAALALTLGLAACGNGDDTGDTASPADTGQAAASATSQAPATTEADRDLPWEIGCGDATVVAHKPEGVPVVEAMQDGGWCALDMDATLGGGEDDETTVEDCADMVEGADRLLEVVAPIPDEQLRSAMQNMAGVIKGSAQSCVDDDNPFALMGMSAATGYAGAAEARMVALGVQTIEADGASSGYTP